MKKLPFNIFLNLGARIWSSGINFILIPVFTKILGFESYGLIGFYTMLISSLGMLDLGLSSTLNRSLAKGIAQNKSKNEIRNMVFSVEILYWILAISIGLIICIAAPIIANHWIIASTISKAELCRIIIIMSILAAFQWPQSLYMGGLFGLGKQTTYNIILIIFSTLKSIGTLLILNFISPTIETFFIWQLLLAICMTIILRNRLWHNLPKSYHKLRFSKVEIRKIRKFAIGMISIGLSSFFLGQIDSILLSKLLPLKEFGIYSFGFSVGTVAIIGISGIVPFLLPKITQAVANNDIQILKEKYHFFSKLIASIVIPCSLMLFFFSKDLLFIWTRSNETAENAYKIVSLISIGFMFNGLMNVPYYLMLAYGWTKFTIYQNIIATILSVPIIFFAVKYFGITGGTSIALVINSLYFFISLPLIHKKLLKGEIKNVYFKDILPTLLITILIIGLGKYFIGSQWNLQLKFIYIFTSLLLTYLILIVSNNEYLSFIKKWFKK